MDNRIIINNYIAYAVHYCMVIAGLLLSSCSAKLFINPYPVFYCIATPYAVVAYILFGFTLLKQNPRNSVMSTVSVFFSLILVAGICYCYGGGEMYFVYMSLNVFFAEPISIITGRNDVFILISLTFPSLLMYLGIILRGTYNRKKKTSKVDIIKQ